MSKRRVLILRGLPGSGKSTFVKDVLTPRRAGDLSVYSADDYHVLAGKYVYDPANAGKAHADCLRRFTEHVRAPEDAKVTSLLVVDNTNTRAFEIAPYASLAAAYGTPCRILYFICPVELALSRNVHTVPATTILAMYSSLLNDPLPSFWIVDTMVALERGWSSMPSY